MADQTPLVSVIIPAYNATKYIGAAIDSVLAQTYENYEIIVVDDGSTDGTKEKLHAYRDRIVYHYQKNRGEAGARNSGIRLAKGPLLAFLDADDLWMPQKLEIQVEALQRYPDAALAFTDGNKIDEQGNVVRPLMPTDPKAFWGWITRYGDPGAGPVAGWWYRELILRNFVHVSSVLLRTRCLDGLNGFDVSAPHGVDYSLWMQLAKRHQFVFVGAPLTIYRQVPTGLSGGFATGMDKWDGAHAIVIERELEGVPPELEDLVRSRLAFLYWKLGWRRFHWGRYAESRAMFRKCLANDRRRVQAWLFLAASYLPAWAIGCIRAVKRRVQRARDSSRGESQGAGSRDGGLPLTPRH